MFQIQKNSVNTYKWIYNPTGSPISLLPVAVAPFQKFAEAEGGRWRCLQPCDPACDQTIAANSRYFHRELYHSGAVAPAAAAPTTGDHKFCNIGSEAPPMTPIKTKPDASHDLMNPVRKCPSPKSEKKSEEFRAVKRPREPETSSRSPVVECACVQEQVASSDCSTSHHLNSDACVHVPPATVPDADGDAPFDSSSICPSGASATPSSLNSFTAGSSSNCHGPVVRAHPSPRHPSISGQTACTGGTGECTTPHLPVRVRGMCKCCYQREYRLKTLVIGNDCQKHQKGNQSFDQSIMILQTYIYIHPSTCAYMHFSMHAFWQLHNCNY